MPQKQRSGKSSFSPTKTQTAQFDHSVLSETYVDLYGKVLAGKTPPSGPTAVIYGAGDESGCVKLPSPQYLTLPAPNGPADGCGWDPKEFVVWKRLPKNLATVHTESQVKPLHEALFSRTSHVVSIAEPTVDSVLHSWLPRSVSGQMIDDNLQLAEAWKQFGIAGFTVPVQQNLARLLNQAFFHSINEVKVRDLGPTLTVDQLKTNLHRSA
jgi:hypothetical protein